MHLGCLEKILVIVMSCGRVSCVRSSGDLRVSEEIIICYIKKETRNDIEPRSLFQDVVHDDKSNLLILLLSSDRTMPMNAVCLDVCKMSLFKFNEVNVSTCRPSEVLTKA